MKNFLSILTHDYGRQSHYSTNQIRAAFNHYLDCQKVNSMELDATIPRSVMTKVLVVSPKSKFNNLQCLSSMVANRDGLCVVWYEGKKEYIHKSFIKQIQEP